MTFVLVTHCVTATWGTGEVGQERACLEAVGYYPPVKVVFETVNHIPQDVNSLGSVSSNYVILVCCFIHACPRAGCKREYVLMWSVVLYRRVCGNKKPLFSVQRVMSRRCRLFCRRLLAGVISCTQAWLMLSKASGVQAYFIPGHRR